MNKQENDTHPLLGKEVRVFEIGDDTMMFLEDITTLSSVNNTHIVVKVECPDGIEKTYSAMIPWHQIHMIDTVGCPHRCAEEVEKS